MDHVIATSMVAQQEMAQRLNLNVSDLTCFGYVLEAGEELLTAGDLASRLHVTTGAMTGIVNRLERAGYVTRRPDPADRRRVRIAALPPRSPASPLSTALTTPAWPSSSAPTPPRRSRS